jgi:hypothetical protein
MEANGEFMEWNDRVFDVFREFGDARQNIRADRMATQIQDRIIAAYASEFGLELAADIAFQASEGISQFAFLTALHLSPDSFTDEQIRDGIEALTLDGVSHVMALTHLLGQPLQDVFELGLKIES